MGEASAMRMTPANFGVRSGEIRTKSTTIEPGRSAHLLESDAERVGYLVRCAMNFLESDLHAAWCCLHDASTLLASEFAQANDNSPPLPDGFQSGGLARWQAKRALAYIEANLGSRMLTRELAELVHFSKSHFSRAFKRSLGMPPMTYVAARRVERAKLMITTTHEQLNEIALACGFSDQSHLNRSFRRWIGMTPGVWRRVIVDGTPAGEEAAA